MFDRLAAARVTALARLLPAVVILGARQVGKTALARRTFSNLPSHPIRSASWETFVIEDVLRREQIQPPGSHAHFWRTAAGAEIDLLIERGGERIDVEVKTARGDQPRTGRALEEALGS